MRLLFIYTEGKFQFGGDSMESLFEIASAAFEHVVHGVSAAMPFVVENLDVVFDLVAGIFDRRER
jgi:hypothetical protein